MRRADRLLLIVQILRRNRKPMTAAAMAQELEVALRTIYRDIATLQSARVPIDGEAGVGYVLRKGYDLPPMMFSTNEIDAIVLGARMVAERGDPLLSRAAQDVIAKIREVLPGPACDQLWKSSLLVPHALEPAVGFGAHVGTIREAIRDNRKLQITYVDTAGTTSTRTIWPLGLYLFSHVTLVCAWCELRQNNRAFRSDRITDCAPSVERFDAKGGRLMDEFLLEFLQKQNKTEAVVVMEKPK